MYRTVAHLPPEALLRNEVQDVRHNSPSPLAWQGLFRVKSGFELLCSIALGEQLAVRPQH